MVKFEISNVKEGVHLTMDGNLFKVMAETMLLIEKAHDAFVEQDKNAGESFRCMVKYWAEGGFDD